MYFVGFIILFTRCIEPTTYTPTTIFFSRTCTQSQTNKLKVEFISYLLILVILVEFIIISKLQMRKQRLTNNYTNIM